MGLLENIRVALRALNANKLRSILTMLGIIIGVGAVVALTGIGNGVLDDVTSEIEGIGSNLIIVVPGTQETGRGEQRFVPLTWSDYQAVERQVGNEVAGIAPTLNTSVQASFGREVTSVSMEASRPAYINIRSREIVAGRMYTSAEDRAGARVAVLGSQTAEDLFGSLNPLGRDIKLNGVRFQVIGILNTVGGGGFGPSEDEVVYVPLETAYDRILGSDAIVNGERTVGAIFLSAVDNDDVNARIVEIERVLRRQHGLRLSDDVDFSVISQDAILDTFAVVEGVLISFLTFIAGISLIVGGIGIMNIMLVSVTERTREIGLRKAVGAKKRTILLQFLIETVTLSLIGGIIGIGLGYGVAWAVTFFDVVNAQVTPGAVAMAFGFAALVGVLFGIYPAYRAANLSPIEALRYE